MSWRSAVIFTFLLLLPPSTFASGLGQGARIAGMGAAFIAVSDDASAIASNPAGMTQMKGTHIYGGLSVLAPTTSFRGPSGEGAETLSRYFLPPHFYAVTDFGTRDLRFGLGVFSPFGIGGRIWPDGGPTRFLATRDEILTLTLNPSVGWRISPAVSVGLGIDIMYSENRKRWMVSQPAPGAPEAVVSQKGSGVAKGFNAGVLISPASGWRIALVYRSLLKLRHKGTAEVSGIAPLLRPLFGGSTFSTDMDTTVTLPDIWTAGIAYSPSPRLTLSVEGDRPRWSRMKAMVTDLKKEVPLAGISDRITITKNRDCWVAKAGFEYRATDIVTVRGGYAFWGNPVPSEVLDPGNPESNQHTFSGGLGYRFRKFVIDGYYMLGLYGHRTSSNPALPGTYHGNTHYAGMSVGYSF